MTQRKIAFVFPGQGAQYVGMGKELYEAFPEAKELFQHADHVLDRDLSNILFEGPADALTETRNSQPAIYTMSMAVLRTVLKQFPNLTPFVCAGHSLGEYSAVTAAGYATFEEVLPVVQLRGEAMNDACEEAKGTMAAVIGLDGPAVSEVVEAMQMPEDIWVANFNCPGQVVVSGTPKGIDAAAEKLRAAGARRVMPLQVHGAFHSPMMASAERRLSEKVKELKLVDCQTQLVMNVTGSVVSDLEQMQHNLILQMTRPVQWEQSVRAMMDLGVDLFIEMGPGKVLSGLNKRIGVTAPTVNVDKVADLESVASAIEELALK